jgi:hypothetical protein
LVLVTSGRPEDVDANRAFHPPSRQSVTMMRRNAA